MKRILFITGDFDENEVRTTFYDDIDHMVNARAGWKDYKEMKAYIDKHGWDGEDLDGSERMLMELIEYGYYVDEWHHYEVYYGDMVMGVGDV